MVEGGQRQGGRKETEGERKERKNRERERIGDFFKKRKSK